MSRPLLCSGVLLFAAWLAGCQSGLSAAVEPSEPLDERYFEVCVQPILTKSCAALLCHGNGQRYYRIYAPNRLRLGRSELERAKPFRDPDDPDEDAKGLRELRANYLASMFLVDRESPDDSLLLRKPLDQHAGGHYHGGEQEYGQGDVYLDTEEADYRVLREWIVGRPEEDAACTRPLDPAGEEGMP